MSENKPKKPDVRTLFVERMKREGREKEWLAKVREIQAEKGVKWGQATHPAMIALGYEGPEKERELALAHDAKSLPPDAAEGNLAEVRTRLPDRAPIAQEINWVLSNGAMFRRARNRHDEIHVTLADVLGPPKCPSKAALTLLQHCVNHPSEFYKQFLADMKRVTKDDNAANVDEVEDLDLAEVEKILEEVK